jgi:DNA-binding NarL/FixJ family response regulator
MTSVLIADDQALVRVGLRKILESEPETEVVGEAGDGEDAIAAARLLRPDLVLMDIRMPTMDGLEATRRIRAGCQYTRILLLTNHATAIPAGIVDEVGADGLLDKAELADRLPAALARFSGSRVAATT